MKNQLILAILFAGIVFCACKKGTNKQLNGTYSGFFVSYNNDPLANTIPPRTVAATVIFSGDKYTSSSNADHYPAGGSGMYVAADNSISFKDENTWTANFDWNLILTGKYDYTVKGDSIFLVKHNGYNHYQYRLKKD